MKRAGTCELEDARTQKKKTISADILHAISYLQMRCAEDIKESVVYHSFQVMRTLSSQNVQDISQDALLAAICIIAFPNMETKDSETLPLSLFTEETKQIISEVSVFLQHWKSSTKEDLQAQFLKFKGYESVVCLALQNEFKTLVEKFVAPMTLDKIELFQSMYFIREAIQQIQCDLKETFIDFVENSFENHCDEMTWDEFCEVCAAGIPMVKLAADIMQLRFPKL